MNTENKTIAFYITKKGEALARVIAPSMAIKFNPDEVGGYWQKGNTLVYIMASGIVVRCIAKHIKSKTSDPAVLVLDEAGKNVISLLSGHLGGANDAANSIAKLTGAQAVITTASDVNGLPSLDLWAVDNSLAVENPNILPKISTRMLDNGCLSVFTEFDIELPAEFKRVDSIESADAVISNRFKSADMLSNKLCLAPRQLVLGIGCNSGTSAVEIESSVIETLQSEGFSIHAVSSIATIDLKTNEPGIASFASKYNLPIRSFRAEELNAVKSVSESDVVMKAVGAKAVSEPSAILGSIGGVLIVPKRKLGNVTVAVAKSAPIKTKGKLYIVGTGPGGYEHITPKAMSAIRESDVVVGYGTYMDLIKDLIKGKEQVATAMTQEIDRCQAAIESAESGKTVSIICGGDPGIYAMAGLALELMMTKGLTDLPVETIPGISALNASAARLGAPLMHDFAVVSLSDRLTPWETIIKRLDSAGEADFVIVLYNPKSKGRKTQIEEARRIIMKHRPPETPVGIVRAAMREDESVIITNLKDMLSHDIDMQTTVVIGNSRTFVWSGRMITPRGYEKKKGYPVGGK